MISEIDVLSTLLRKKLRILLIYAIILIKEGGEKMTVMEEMGKRIKFLRVRKGYSQEDLALKTGYTNKAAISKIEKGERGVRTELVPKFADVLGVSVAYLLYGKEDEQVSLDDMDLLRAFWKAPPHIQKLIRQMLDISP